MITQIVHKTNNEKIKMVNFYWNMLPCFVIEYLGRLLMNFVEFFDWTCHVLWLAVHK